LHSKGFCAFRGEISQQGFHAWVRLSLNSWTCSRNRARFPSSDQIGRSQVIGQRATGVNGTGLPLLQIRNGPASCIVSRRTRDASPGMGARAA